MTKNKRGNARVCSMHWYDLRPTEYAPNTYNWGQCVMCDIGPDEHGMADDFVYRVSWAEIDLYNKEVVK